VVRYDDGDRNGVHDHHVDGHGDRYGNGIEFCDGNAFLHGYRIRNSGAH